MHVYGNRPYKQEERSRRRFIFVILVKGALQQKERGRERKRTGRMGKRRMTLITKYQNTHAQDARINHVFLGVPQKIIMFS
jgi:hypothetical protein